jgi:oligopeptide transport system ATP-binding protein
LGAVLARRGSLMQQGTQLVEVRNLAKYFATSWGLALRGERPVVRAVDGVSFSIERGKTFGLVGESGCGKSTIARLLLRLVEASSGSIRFDGADVLAASKDELRRLRRNMQMVFQDPFSSLNPRMTVRDILREPLRVHGVASGSEDRRVAELLELVGLSRAYATRYPHEFSGGQRQRIGIARALALNPKFIVCDEAVSALDVSIQSQILNLLKDLQREFGLTYLFISHNLSVVKYISDTVGVMYLGHLVEIADKATLFASPNHPYTKALLSAVPVPEPGRAKTRIVLEGDVPSSIRPPPGCRFHTRCNVAMPRCSAVEPQLRELAPGRFSACLLNEN